MKVYVADDCYWLKLMRQQRQQSKTNKKQKERRITEKIR